MSKSPTLMQSADWWAYSLTSTLPSDPCGSSSPLASNSHCPLPGVQPSQSYEAALGILREGSLKPSEAKTLLALAKCMRKWRFSASSEAKARKDKALDGFVARNNAARALIGCETIPWAIRSRMRFLLDSWLPEIGSVADGRFGPGACAEKWSHCKRFKHLAQWCHESAHWPDVPRGHADMDAHVARLCAVPKQFDKDRLITVEPAYRTFAQQAVRDTLLASIHFGPLSGSCMDLGFTNGQRIQRKLAKQASASKAYATLDLKDASDNITWEDVQNVFPPWVVMLLEATRSDSFTDPRDRSVSPMAIFAGMGNATTFVVETLFFSAYVKAFAWTRGMKCRVSTFGDDVICTDKVAQALLAEGQSPCFVVNEHKSFVGNDALRESCGIFAYNGVDITVPRIDGYDKTPGGREALSALSRSLNRDPLFWGLASAVAAEGGLPVTRGWILGFPTLVDPLCCTPVNEELEQSVVWDPGLQRLAVKVAWYEPRYAEVRCTNAPDDDVTAGLLCACLLGQARTVRRGHHSYVRFDAEEAGHNNLQQRKRWHEYVADIPPSDEDLILAREESVGLRELRRRDPVLGNQDLFSDSGWSLTDHADSGDGVPVRIWRCTLKR